MGDTMGAPGVTAPDAQVVARRKVAVERRPDGDLRYIRPKGMDAPGLPAKALEALDGEVLRRQIRAEFGDLGVEEYGDAALYALEDVLAELAPRDALERMLACQAVLLHRQLLTVLHRGAGRGLTDRDRRGYSDVAARLATAFRKHVAALRGRQAATVAVAVHGDGNTINAAAQQVINGGDQGELRKLLDVLEPIAYTLRSKLEAVSDAH